MEIIIKKEERQMIYNSDTRIVTFFTRHGALMTVEMPEQWHDARVVEFMQSLFKADEIIT